MKRNQLFQHHLMLLGLFLLFALNASAYDVEQNGIRYNYNNEEMEVVGYSGEITDVIIPSQIEYNGEMCPVTSIGQSAFSQCDSLTSIDIPNSVILIGPDAFHSCYNLTSIKLPDHITSIDHGTFLGCRNLTSIEIPNSVSSIGLMAFYGCTSLTSIEIPNSVTVIDDYAFLDCGNLISATIGSSVESIGAQAFYSCDNLESIILGNSVRSIGENAFYNYYGYERLIKAAYPNNIENPFTDYPNCRSIEYSPYNALIENGWIFDSEKKEIIFAPINLTGELTIKDNIERIDSYAFSKCNGITSVIIGNSVKWIEDGAFEECNGLIKAIYPDTNTIYYRPFSESCYSFTYEPEGATIENGWVYGSDNEILFAPLNLEGEFAISENVKCVGDNAFWGCDRLTSVTIPNSVISIGKSAFGNCSNLTSISIPNTVSSIETVAFSGCTSLKELTIQEGPEILRLGDDSHWGVFSDCPLESLYLGRNLSYSQSPFKNFETLVNVEISNTVTSIGNESFYGCSGLLSIAIPNSVTSIGESAFTGCTSLSSISIPNSVTSIGESAFADCTSLSSISIPNSVTTLGKAAFKDCSGLSYISFGKLLRTIGEQAFYCCNPETVETFSYNIEGIESSGLSKYIDITLRTDSDFAGIGNTNLTYFHRLIFKDKNNRDYGLATSSNNLNFSNCLFNEGDKYIIPFEECSAVYTNNNQYIEFRGEDITENLARPDGFTFTPSVLHKENKFCLYGDADDPSLTIEINLKAAGTLINELNLQSIGKIQALTISGDINGTDIMAINRMTALKYLNISDANLVEGGATYRDNLKTANNTIGKNFFNDIQLEVLHLPRSVQTIEEMAFENTTLKVVSMPESLTSIGVGAFRGCTALRYITIPGTVTKIQDYAFSDTYLKSVTIEDGDDPLEISKEPFKYCPLESVYIGRDLAYSESPFSYNSSLKSVSFSNHVTFIGQRAFLSTGLTSVIIPESVIMIDDLAFSNCSGLDSVTLPASIQHIGYEAFSNCTSLNSISLPDNTTTILWGTFWGCNALTSISIPRYVTYIGRMAFYGCTSLTAVHISDLEAWCRIDFEEMSNPLIYAHHLFLNNEELTDLEIPNSIVRIPDLAFTGCSGLTSLTISPSVTSIGEYAFSGTSIKELLLPASVVKIGEYAFSNENIVKLVSLNTTPPEICPSTFTDNVKASAKLYVPQEALAYYWLDPVWKDFLNISDDLISLQAIPDVRYGDEEIDLSQYAPEGAALTYKSSNEDVVKINGTTMQIVGAGTATVEAALEEDEATTELAGRMRQIFVDQADLIVTVEDIVIKEGEPVPDFTYLAEGLQYDDTLDDIEKLPVPVTDVDENSPAGEYEVRFTEGSDRNYRIATKPAKITVSVSTDVNGIAADAIGTEIEVYDLDGRLLFRGERADAHLAKGIYIIRQGNVVRKVTVR